MSILLIKNTAQIKAIFDLKYIENILILQFYIEILISIRTIYNVKNISNVLIFEYFYTLKP